MDNLATAGHRGVYLLNPFTYPDHSGNTVTIEGGLMGTLLRGIKIWGLEKMEELQVDSAQKMHEFVEFNKMAAEETGSNLISQKIPKVAQIHAGADNNLARWLSTIIRRWRICVEYNKTSMATLINTIKEQAGPLRTSLLHKTTYQDVWTIIKGRSCVEGGR